jgi:hypothetical protein
MSHTAVGLFDSAGAADHVLLDLEASNFPRREIRVVREPIDMAVTGVMSTPRADFEVGLERELRAIGATVGEANAYADGVRRGGVLMFATGSSREVDSASEIMNRHGAVDVRELTGAEPDFAGSVTGTVVSPSGGASQTGRVRQAGGGARMFVW